MAFDTMESLFDLDLTTEESTTLAQPALDVDVQNRNSETGLISKGQSKNAQPYCVNICGMRDAIDSWNNLTDTVINLHNSVASLEICIVIMTVVITMFALVSLTLLVHYVRKNTNENRDPDWIPSSSLGSSGNGSTLITLPSSTASSGSATTTGVGGRNEIQIKRVISTPDTPPPPSRQSGDEYRSTTPMPYGWLQQLTVEKDSTPLGRMTTPQIRGTTPMPLEIRDDDNDDDDDDEGPVSVPGGGGGAPPVDVTFLSAKHAMRKASWPALGPRFLKPLEEHPHESMHV